MKQKSKFNIMNKTMRKTSLLTLSTMTLLIHSVVSANNDSSQGARPPSGGGRFFGKNACLAELQNSTQQTETYTQQRLTPSKVQIATAELLMNKLNSQKRFHVTESLEARLKELLLTNEGVVDSVTGILADLRPENVEFNQLRLEIMSQFQGLDSRDSAQVQAAYLDAAGKSKMDLAMFVHLIRLDGLSPATRSTIQKFLEEIKLALEGSAALSDVLQIAKNAIAINTGFDIDISRISDAVRSREGVAQLFKGYDDLQILKIVGTNKQVLELSLTPREGVAMDQEAFALISELLTIARNPITVGTFVKTKMTSGVQNSLASADYFLQRNPTLNQSSTHMAGVRSTNQDVAQNIDQLQAQLAELGAVVGPNDFRAKLTRELRERFPITQRVIKDPRERRRSILAKINEIERILIDGGSKIEQNNVHLIATKSEALNEVKRLQKEMAKLFMASGYLEDEIAKAKSIGQMDLATTLEAEVGPTLARQLNAALTLNAVLLASIEAINQLIRVNIEIVTTAETLRTLAGPALKITEATRIAGEDAALILKQQIRVSRFIEKTFTQMGQQLKSTNETLSKNAGLSFIDPVVIAKVMNEINTERNAHKTRMIDAFNQLTTANENLVAALNLAQSFNELNTIGIETHNILNQKPDSKAPKR